MTQDVEVENMSNALICFYEKVVQVEPPVEAEDADKGEESGPNAEASAPAEQKAVVEEDLSVIADQDATEKDVWQTNVTFIRSSYLLDTDFHSFQLKLLQ